MAADTGDDHVNLVGAGIAAAGFDRGRAGRVLRTNVRGNQHIGRRRFVVETAVDHRPSTLDQLLGRLSDKNERARPLGFQLRHDFGDFNQKHDMCVMSAGVHHGDEAAAWRSAGSPTGVRQAGFLEHGQGVHIAAEHDDRTRPVFQNADDARLADAGVRLVAELLELLSDERGRLHLLKAELRISVQVLENLDQPLFVTIDERGDFFS